MRATTLRCRVMIFWLPASSASTQELTDTPLQWHSAAPLLRSDGAFPVYVAQGKVRNVLAPDADETHQLHHTETPDSGLAVALTRAWKRDFIKSKIAHTAQS